MKIRKQNLDKYAKSNGYLNGRALLISCGAGELAYAQFKKGRRIGYDLVKDMYNALGEEVILNIINFEEETLNGFKAKFVQVGNQLY